VKLDTGKEACPIRVLKVSGININNHIFSLSMLIAADNNLILGAMIEPATIHVGRAFFCAHKLLIALSAFSD